MQKERAASAVANGLPVPTPPPARQRYADGSSSRHASNSSSPSRSLDALVASRRLPIALKLLLLVLAILGSIYGMTVFRDHLDQAKAQQLLGDLQQLFQVVKVDGYIHHQGSHNAQADAVVECFI